MYRITNFTAESEEKETNFKDMDEALKEATCNPDAYSIEQMDRKILIRNIHQPLPSNQEFEELQRKKFQFLTNTVNIKVEENPFEEIHRMAAGTKVRW